MNYFINMKKNQKSCSFGVNPQDTWIELFESNIFSQPNHFPICYNIVSYHVYCILKMKIWRVSERMENSFFKVYTIILIHSIESNWSVFDGVEKFQSAFVTWPLKKNMKVRVVPFRRGNIRCRTGLIVIKNFYLFCLSKNCVVVILIQSQNSCITTIDTISRISKGPISLKTIKFVI